MSAEKWSGAGRSNVLQLMSMLHYISRHGGVAIPELCADLGLSRATVSRYINTAKHQYGVDINWRIDNSMPSHGEYSIDDWGVFDQSKVDKFLKRPK